MSRPVVFTPLKQIDVPGGQVFHALKRTEASFSTFGEAYFSFVHKATVKGWKRHREMTCNLVVPVGLVVINCVDSHGDVSVFRLGPDEGGQYGRLTIPPGTWFAFGGLGDGVNCLLNIADILHDPDESETTPLDAIGWSW